MREGNSFELSETADMRIDRRQLLLAGAAFGLPLRMRADRIFTVAGIGTEGYSGDDGPAAAARLNQPFHVAFAPNGDMLIADALNHCIRRVDKRGKISTIAGTGRRGWTGDGGSAKLATLNEPYGVTAGRDGSLYIVDRLNAAVRRVDARTGRITTLAGTGVSGFSGDGGPADKAQLREPNGIALDTSGGLLIADVRDNRLRRVDLRSGTVSTLCGTGRRACEGNGGPAHVASINGCRAVATAPDGAIYICEREGNAIRRIDPKTGRIEAFAGTGAPGYSGDGGPALEATFRGPKWVAWGPGAIYVVDTENHAVRRIDLATRIITTAAGGRRGAGGDGGPAAQAELDRPHGCCVEKGVLFIADSENHRVRACAVPAS